MTSALSQKTGLDEARFEHALRLGDDALVLAQRLGELCGHAATLELDLGFANVGLDLLGQATNFLALAGEIEGKGRDADALAFQRDVLAYRNCILVEQPNGDFARTIARQFLFSSWQLLLLRQMEALPDERVSAIAAKAVKEVTYHEKLAASWLVRLGDGTEESHRRVVSGLSWSFRFVDELFLVDPVIAPLVAAGEAVDVSTLRPAWDARVNEVLPRRPSSGPSRCARS